MKLMRAALLVSVLAACGGKSKSEPATPATPEPAAAADCCCDYIKEEGDPAGDDWSENQTYEFVNPQTCADLSGQCVAADSCNAAAAEEAP